ncbi:MAG: hypothetical protein KC423_24730 [Anaerolineales bacterium]|nr:hypothetical protein [Anaerolineales bacterium]
MRLRRYLSRVYDTIHIRQEITILSFEVEELIPNQEGSIKIRLQFWDRSQLQIEESLRSQGSILIKATYSYHYQDANNNLIFRYDNAPHHPHIRTYPHHKHTTQGIIDAKPPDITDILKEIDALLYNNAG